MANPTPMAVIRRGLGVLVLIQLLYLGGGTARAQSVDAENDFVARIAEERASAGLGALAHADDLQAVARRHAQRMADRGEPYHNPDLATEVSGASIVAENVGRGMSVEDLHRAFMSSQTHRDVILHPDLTQLGVGVVTTDEGELYVVEVFRRPQDSSPPPSSPPPTSPPAAPAPRDAAVPPPAIPVTTVPTTTTVPTATTSIAPPLPRDDARLAAMVASARSETALGRVTPTIDVAAITPPVDLARNVPTAAWAAALLLAMVVGLQGQVLRRMGLVA